MRVSSLPLTSAAWQGKMLLLLLQSCLEQLQSRVMNGGWTRARSLFSPPRSLSFPPWHCGSYSGAGCSGRSLALEHVGFGNRGWAGAN